MAAQSGLCGVCSETLKTGFLIRWPIYKVKIFSWQYYTGPDSLVVKASASGVVGCGFAPQPRHTKGGKNGTGSSPADARNKRVVPGRYKKVGIRYL